VYGHDTLLPQNKVSKTNVIIVMMQKEDEKSEKVGKNWGQMIK
jgi:hypothetical protein